MRKWSTPVLRPAAPFIAGGLAVFYLVAKAQDAMINSKCLMCIYRWNEH